MQYPLCAVPVLGACEPQQCNADSRKQKHGNPRAGKGRYITEFGAQHRNHLRNVKGNRRAHARNKADKQYVFARFSRQTDRQKHGYKRNERKSEFFMIQRTFLCMGKSRALQLGDVFTRLGDAHFFNRNRNIAEGVGKFAARKIAALGKNDCAVDIRTFQSLFTSALCNKPYRGKHQANQPSSRAL